MIDFSTVLASAVHDMKNSLCLLLQSIETLTDELGQSHPGAAEQLASIHYEASRLNTSLMHILSLYRVGKDKLPLNIDEYFVEDLIDEVVATNQNYTANKNMTIEVKQPPDLVWYYDQELICALLNDILINAIRYSNKHILLNVSEEEGYLCIRVEDDGMGYPQSMIDANLTDMQDFDISTGRTGLGLYFARMIANTHTRGDRNGNIVMENGGTYGGSVFTLKLP